jgi:YbbR domain-containing protein
MITFLRNLFLEDPWLKLFSFALAALTWLTVTVAIQRQTSPSAAYGKEMVFFNMPVTILSSTGDVHNVRVDPREVQLTVQGDARTLANLTARDLHLMVDVTGLSSDIRKPIEVSTPPGISQVRVVPAEVLVIFSTKL